MQWPSGLERLSIERSDFKSYRSSFETWPSSFTRCCLSLSGCLELLYRNRIAVLSQSFHMCLINVKNTLFRTFCTPMYTCHLWWNYKAQSFHKLKVAFNNAFRMMHNLPTYCSASEMFTVNRVADFKAVIRNLVHRFMTRLTISKHLLVRSI